MIAGLNMPPMYDITTPEEEDQQPQPIDINMLKPNNVVAETN